MRVENLQVRVPDEDVAALDEVARFLQASRSEAARRALEEGLKALRLDHATQQFVRGEFSLARAAEFAGVSIHTMADHLAAQGIPYYRYGADELERDADVAAAAMKRAKKR